MFITHQVALHQRAVLFQHGLPRRALGPGRHTVWGFGLTVETLDTRELLVDLPDEVRAVFGEGTFGEARIAPHERGLLFRRERPEVFLEPGLHRFWALDPTVELHVYDTGEPVPDVTDDLLLLLPQSDVVQATINEFQRGLLYVNGRFERVLPPGRYAFWTRIASPVSLRLIDMRRKQINVAGQELMTKDKVTLRLSLAVDFAPADPETAPHTIADPDGALYTLAQLALREHVATATLAELRFSILLAGTEQIAQTLRSPALESLRSRITYAHALRPFTIEDTRNYLRFHLERAEVDPAVLSDDAARKIFHASQGKPRNVNQLALHALIAAAAQGRDVIDGRFMQQMIAAHPLYRSGGGEARA